jgi:hypothetical protein
MMKDYISTAQASKIYGLSTSQIRLLLKKGKINGRKIARNWLVIPNSLASYMANRPKPGLRPGQKIRRGGT